VPLAPLSDQAGISIECAGDLCDAVDLHEASCSSVVTADRIPDLSSCQTGCPELAGGHRMARSCRQPGIEAELSGRYGRRVIDLDRGRPVQRVDLEPLAVAHASRAGPKHRWPAPGACSKTSPSGTATSHGEQLPGSPFSSPPEALPLPSRRHRRLGRALHRISIPSSTRLTSYYRWLTSARNTRSIPAERNSGSPTYL
jgi:hypothetical protein